MSRDKRRRGEGGRVCVSITREWDEWKHLDDHTVIPARIVTFILSYSHTLIPHIVCKYESIRVWKYGGMMVDC